MIILKTLAVLKELYEIDEVRERERLGFKLIYYLRLLERVGRKEKACCARRGRKRAKA